MSISVFHFQTFSNDIKNIIDYLLESKIPNSIWIEFHDTYDLWTHDCLDIQSPKIKTIVYFIIINGQVQSIDRQNNE